nr:hypothetical protein [Tanacetum cinerariifolium]
MVKSSFSGRVHSDMLFNNMCEVLNGKIVDEREKPIIIALEFIKEYCMKRIINVGKYDSFLFEIEPDQGKLTSIVMKDNLAESRVHVPNVLTTHPTLMLDSDFIPSDNSLPEFETFYFDIEEKNSDSTTIHADISLLDLECFNFDFKPDPGKLTSIVDSEIRKNVPSTTNVNLPPEEDHSPFFAYVV